MSDYAARYRAARGYAGMTQVELAEALGVDEQTIKRREKDAGQKNAQEPKRGERIAVAQITGVPLDFIEGGWEAVRAPASSDDLSRAAALLRQALGAAGQAAARDPESAPEGAGASDRSAGAAGGASR